MALIVVYGLLVTVIRTLSPAPAAVAMAWPEHSAPTLNFFSDDSWLNESGDRELSQSLFDALYTAISEAQSLIVIDMFLFNDWQGPVAENHRPLANELTQALLDRKRQKPDINIVLITDPINTVYGGLPSVHLEKLRNGGIQVVLTALDQLQDSNPAWSGFWRVFLAPFGNAPGNLLPNPFGEGRVSLRSYLTLLNFKANHRKLMVADTGNAGDSGLLGLVSSANPHDGSSAHRNVSVVFTGQAAHDLLDSELALLRMSDADAVAQSVLDSVAAMEKTASETSPAKTPASGESTPANSGNDPVLRIISESGILSSVNDAIGSAGSGDRIDVLMFYLSERSIVESLKDARARGAEIRVLLDVNNDAFGRSKNGVPNRPVAAELVDAGVKVRWCATSGEQCHAKWLHVAQSGEHQFILGSANYTRRNLRDLNMETNVSIRSTAEHPVTNSMISFFDRQWNNSQGKTYSVDYEKFSDDSLWLTLQYRLMEATGLSTF